MNLLTVRQVAKKLGISKTTIYRLHQRGEFAESLMVGGGRRWSEESITQWMQNRHLIVARAPATPKRVSAVVGNKMPRICFIRTGARPGKPTLIAECGYIVCQVAPSFVLVNYYVPEEGDGLGNLELWDTSDLLWDQDRNGDYRVELFHSIEDMAKRVNDIHEDIRLKLTMSDCGNGKFMSLWNDVEAS